MENNVISIGDYCVAKAKTKLRKAEIAFKLGLYQETAKLDTQGEKMQDRAHG